MTIWQLLCRGVLGIPLWLWQLLCLGLFLFLVGVPVCLPLGELIRNASRLAESDFFFQFLPLLGNTLIMVLGCLLVAGPVGVLLAFVLFRTDMPFRTAFVYLFVLSLFIPLPIHITAWHAAFTAQEGIARLLWTPRPGQPWPQGFFPAIWVHSLAALPWVVLIVGQSLRQTPAVLEEHACLLMPRWKVIFHVTLPCSRPALLLAGLWITLLVTGDISVTDMFLVRTLAEAVYLQFSRGGVGTLGQAVLPSLPLSLALGLLILISLFRLKNRFPLFQIANYSPFLFRLGKGKYLALVLLLVICYWLFGVPLRNLIDKAGRTGTSQDWQLLFLAEGLWASFALNGKVIWQSFMEAVLGVGGSVLLAIGICWTSRNNLLLQGLYILLLVLSCTLSAPVLGFGLKEWILQLIELFPRGWVAKNLYYGPSAVPLIWAYLLRTLPFYMAILWPSFRQIPRELDEAALLESSSPLRRLLRVQLPLVFPALLVGIIGATALALNEVGTSRLVNTPGVETFTLVLFDRMHYGVTQEVACLALLLILVLLLVGIELTFRFLADRVNRRRKTPTVAQPLVRSPHYEPPLR